MADGYEDATALVTGAASGIGRATAERFAEAGANVVAADLDREGAEATAAALRDAGGEAHALTVDVTDSAQVEAMVAETVDRYGSLDVAFNNAGIEEGTGDTAELAEDTWDRVVGTNLKGVWLCLKHELPVMVEHGGGAIVNTASIAGFASVGSAPYVASKHGVVGLTRTAATEYADEGVRVNAVCPGFVDTPLLDRAREESPEELELAVEAQPLGRMGEPGEIADTVRWLLSEEASFVTGNAYPVDGGFLAQ
jgi:NAD(P)-dependent dehydrogenase (short-subunit alcohol dehydrogenase family)